MPVEASPSESRNRLLSEELQDAWPVLAGPERLEWFRLMPLDQAESFFASVSARGKAGLLELMREEERRIWIGLLPPDELADVLQHSPPPLRTVLLGLLGRSVREEVDALLAYARDVAGGLMNPRFLRVHPEMDAAEAIHYVRRQIKDEPETVSYAYVLDSDQRLLGVVSMRQLIAASEEHRIREVMATRLVTLHDETDQEEVARAFARHDLMALPVVDDDRRMVGIVTVDDVVDVLHEEATEDIQKIGGSSALGAPYLKISLPTMIRKRASWLVLLFIGEMLTATAMGFFENEIQRAVVLALFIPLVISSGGNSGSQATTLVIRAMALQEVRLRDWLRVMRREIVTGLSLGLVLGAIGFVRIMLWPARLSLYGPHYPVVALTVAFSLVGIVLWGSLMGSMLPLALRRLGFDPASASAPMVATLVDVTGLVIYFSIAALILHGTLL